MYFFRLANDAVPFTRIRHHFKRNGGFLQRVDHLHGVVKKHVVIGHAMNDQQRPSQVLRIGDRTRDFVFAITVIGVTHVPFGVVGVVQAPVGNRRAGDACLV